MKYSRERSVNKFGRIEPIRLTFGLGMPIVPLTNKAEHLRPIFSGENRIRGQSFETLLGRRTQSLACRHLEANF